MDWPVAIIMAGIFALLFWLGWDKHRSDERRRRWLEWEDKLAAEERAREQREAFERQISEL